MKVRIKTLIVITLCSLAVVSAAYAEEGDMMEPAAAPAETGETLVDVLTAGPDAAVPEPAATVTTEVVSESAVELVKPVAEKTTLENLQAAFDGESNAHAKYLEFAKKAEEEGYGKAASLFRAAARAERIHFNRHARIIKKMGGTPAANIVTPVIGTTAENLQDAIRGETYENTVMYPEFLAKAQADKNEDAIDAFEDAGAAEGVHAKLYQGALDNLKAWKGKDKKFYVCSVCGNVVEKLDLRKCPICQNKKENFLMVR